MEFLESLELLVMACAGMLFLVLLSVASIEFRLRRIEKKLKVLVPETPPKPIVEGKWPGNPFKAGTMNAAQWDKEHR